MDVEIQERLDDLRQDFGKRLDVLGGEVKSQLGVVNVELRELTKALRDLIRLDGDIRRLQDAVGRIGRETEDHEKRLRVIESRGTAQTVTLGFWQSAARVGTTIAAAVIAAAITASVVRSDPRSTSTPNAPEASHGVHRTP